MPDTSTLHTVLEAAAKSVGDKTTSLLIGGLTLGGKLLYDLYTRWRANRKEAKQSDGRFIANKTNLLNAACGRICQWAGAKHTCVYALSNGERRLNNDSIQKLSMVGEGTLALGLPQWMHESQNFTTTSFSILMDEMEAGHNVWLYPDKEGQDYLVNAYMHTRGFTTRLALPLQGDKKKLIGILCLSWTNGMHTEDMLPSLADLETHRRQCAAILAQS